MLNNFLSCFFFFKSVIFVSLLIYVLGHVFKLKGHCSRGISCRFGKQHITENGRNIVDEGLKSHYEKNVPKTLTFYSKEIENDLRKRTYDFKKSEEVLDVLPKAKPPPPVPPFGSFNTPFWGSG